MQERFTRKRTFVAVAEGICDGIILRVEADVVDRPAIYGDRANSFGGDFGAGSEAALEFGDDVVDVPAEAVRALDGVIRKTMDQLNVGAIVRPTQQRHATTLCSEVNRYQGTQIFGRRQRLARLGGEAFRLHRRYASVRPPSTGIRWPVVTGAFGPPMKRMASAQSLGSMGTWVRVRLA